MASLGADAQQQLGRRGTADASSMASTSRSWSSSSASGGSSSRPSDSRAWGTTLSRPSASSGITLQQSFPIFPGRQQQQQQQQQPAVVVAPTVTVAAPPAPNTMHTIQARMALGTPPTMLRDARQRSPSPEHIVVPPRGLQSAPATGPLVKPVLMRPDSDPMPSIIPKVLLGQERILATGTTLATTAVATTAAARAAPPPRPKPSGAWVPPPGARPGGTSDVPTPDTQRWEDLVFTVTWIVGRQYGFQAFNVNPLTTSTTTTQQQTAQQQQQDGGAAAQQPPVHVPATIFVASDHLVHLLVRNAYCRDKTPSLSDDERFARAAMELHSTIFHPYVAKWAAQVQLPVRPAPMQAVLSSLPYCDPRVVTGLLAELALYMCIYTEAANLRHCPEALWFVYWCAAFSPPMAAVWAGGAPSPLHSMRNRVVHVRNAHQAEHAALTAMLRYDPDATRPDKVGRLLPVLRGKVPPQLAAALPGGPGDLDILLDLAAYGDGAAFFDRLLTPLFQFISHEMDYLAEQGVDVAQRLGYDDINESLCRRDVVHRTLGLLKIGSAEVRAAEPNAAWRHLLQVGCVVEGDESTFDPQAGANFWSAQVFVKTFYERRSWLSIYRAFYRVYAMQLVLFHLLLAASFAPRDFRVVSSALLTHAALAFLERWANWIITRRGPDPLRRRFAERSAVHDAEAQVARAMTKLQQQQQQATGGYAAAGTMSPTQQQQQQHTRSTVSFMSTGPRGLSSAMGGGSVMGTMAHGSGLVMDPMDARLRRRTVVVDGAAVWGVFGFVEWFVLAAALAFFYSMQFWDVRTMPSWAVGATRWWWAVVVGYTGAHLLHWLLTTRDGYCVSLTAALRLPRFLAAHSARPAPSSWLPGRMKVGWAAFAGNAFFWLLVLCLKLAFEYFIITKPLVEPLRAILSRDWLGTACVRSVGVCIDGDWLLLVARVLPYVFICFVDTSICYQLVLTVYGVMRGLLRLDLGSQASWHELLADFHKGPLRWWRKAVSRTGGSNLRRYVAAGLRPRTEGLLRPAQPDPYLPEHPDADDDLYDRLQGGRDEDEEDAFNEASLFSSGRSSSGYARSWLQPGTPNGGGASAHGKPRVNPFVNPSPLRLMSMVNFTPRSGGGGGGGAAGIEARSRMNGGSSSGNSMLDGAGGALPAAAAAKSVRFKSLTKEMDKAGAAASGKVGGNGLSYMKQVGVTGDDASSLDGFNSRDQDAGGLGRGNRRSFTAAGGYGGGGGGDGLRSPALGDRTMALGSADHVSVLEVLGQQAAAGADQQAVWDAFANAWDEIVDDLRGSDLISDGEQGNLKFLRLDACEGGRRPGASSLRPLLLPTFFYAGQVQKFVDTCSLTPAQAVILHELRSLLVWLGADVGLLSPGAADSLLGAAFCSRILDIGHNACRQATLAAAVRLVLMLQDLCYSAAPPAAGYGEHLRALLQLLTGLEAECEAVRRCRGMGRVAEADADLLRQQLADLKVDITCNPDVVADCFGVLVGCSAKATVRRDSQLRLSVVSALVKMLTTPAAAATPAGVEAQRVLSFFTSSLANPQLGRPPAVDEMASHTVLTPVYEEDVLYPLDSRAVAAQLGAADGAAAGRLGLTDLLTESEDKVSLMSYLRSVFPLEWENFKERMAAKAAEAGIEGVPEVSAITEADFAAGGPLAAYGLELQLWASCRGQLLARTVRGMLCYDKAIRLLTKLEYPQPASLNDKEYGAWVDWIARSKFDYVCTCQQYGRYRHSKDLRQRWLSKAVDILLQRFPRLRVAFLDAGASASGPVNYSVMVQATRARRGDAEAASVAAGGAASSASPSGGPAASGGSTAHAAAEAATSAQAATSGAIEELYRVRLPGNRYTGRGIVLGEGKPENQNHAIIFAFGEAVQAIDMNQDNYLAEALKMRNLLAELQPTPLPGAWYRRRPAPLALTPATTGSSLQLSILERKSSEQPTAIVGFREWVFSDRTGALGSFAASAEYAFGTIMQRSMAHPGRVRMHYGHPDVFNKLVAMTSGGLSKATRQLHISEDVFAGYDATLRGNAISYKEYISVGKGRDMGFDSINAFEIKISGGGGEVMLSRDVARLATRLDFFRLLHFYHAGVGYYVSTSFVMLAMYASLFALVLLGLAQATSVVLAAPLDPNDRNSPLGSPVTLYTTLQLEQALQFGLLALLPYTGQLMLEQGVLRAVLKVLRQVVAGSFAFFIFRQQTTSYYFRDDITYGGARHISTGRGFSITTSSFIKLYTNYARSHLYLGAELAFLCVAFAFVKGCSACSYGGLTWGFWLNAASLLLAPFWFNPLTFSMTKVRRDLAAWQAWLAGEVDPATGTNWYTWNRKQLGRSRNDAGGQTDRWWTVTGCLLTECTPPAVLLLAAAARLHVSLPLPGSGVPGGVIMFGVSAAIIWGAVLLASLLRSSLRHRSASRQWRLTRIALTVASLGLLVAFIVLVVRWSPRGDAATNLLLLIFCHVQLVLLVHRGMTHLLTRSTAGRQLVDAGFWLADCALGYALLCAVGLLAFVGVVARVQALMLFNITFARSLRRGKLVKTIGMFQVKALDANGSRGGHDGSGGGGAAVVEPAASGHGANVMRTPMAHGSTMANVSQAVLRSAAGAAAASGVAGRSQQASDFSFGLGAGGLPQQPQPSAPAAVLSPPRSQQQQQQQQQRSTGSPNTRLPAGGVSTFNADTLDWATAETECKAA